LEVGGEAEEGEPEATGLTPVGADGETTPRLPDRLILGSPPTVDPFPPRCCAASTATMMTFVPKRQKGSFSYPGDPLTTHLSLASAIGVNSWIESYYEQFWDEHLKQLEKHRTKGYE
jgi:hypothetical protein